MRPPPKPQFLYVHESHLDLFWIGDYRYCLERGRHVIKEYLDRCVEYPDESFLLETVVFLEHFLKQHPDYEETVRRLWEEGRLDIGTAYVDIMEHLMLAESQVRNIVRGRRWCLDRLGIDSRLAAHADLPGFSAQVGQVYSQAGVDCYSTSRKVFPNGQVWVHVSPDGTGLRVFSHPFHYDFHELRRNAASLNEGRGWAAYLDPQEALKGFPLGKVVVSAGAADQADMECFARRHGKSAREFVEDYRQEFPEYKFGFGTVSAMVREYDGHEDLLPHLSGEIPSVWGMTSVPSAFWQRCRRLEGALLAAELLASMQRWHGLPTIAEARGEWHGTLYERLYYLGKDPIPRGAELEELWKMHIFICDHNFSGNYAPQTAFDKRTIQERALGYAREAVAHGLKGLAGEGDRLMVMNTLNWERTEPVQIELPAADWSPGMALADEAGRAVPWQRVEEAADDDAVRLVMLPTVPPCSYVTIGPSEPGHRQPEAVPLVRDDGRAIHIETGSLSVSIEKADGAVSRLVDRVRGVDWGAPEVGRLYAVYEQKCDVPLGVDESRVLAEQETVHTELVAAGPLYARVGAVKSIMHAHVVQQFTVWQDPVAAVDLTTTILWHGRRRVQMRECLPSAAGREDVWYGTPFYGNNWNNVVPGSGPRNPDEMADMAHWNDYRELQLWVHQRRPAGALTLSSLHATYHWGQAGLEAVLFRTTPSCADDRFFWEHTGELRYDFRLTFGAADDPLAEPAARGQAAFCPLLVARGCGAGMPALPPGSPFVSLQGDGLILSAVHPDPDGTGLIVRFYEAAGKPTAARLAVPGAAAMERADVIGNGLEDLQAREGTAELGVRPHEIVTIRVTPASGA